MSPHDDIIERLRSASTDPMWADHAEVRKTTLVKAADELERLRAALTELVACKDLKDIVDQYIPGTQDPDYHEARDAYNRRKPLAWAAARAALAPQETPR